VTQPAHEPARDAGTVARLEAIVHGRVQGVGFRFFVMRVAAGLAIAGWVANENDGSVRCVAEGSRSDLERLLEALRDGPPGAVVTDVSERWTPATGGMTGFTVRSAGHRGD
jgi:acylphosphatase